MNLREVIAGEMRKKKFKAHILNAIAARAKTGLRNRKNMTEYFENSMDSIGRINSV